jgi:hypothetical protein
VAILVPAVLILVGLAGIKPLLSTHLEAMEAFRAASTTVRPALAAVRAIARRGPATHATRRSA